MTKAATWVLGLAAVIITAVPACGGDDLEAPDRNIDATDETVLVRYCDGTAEPGHRARFSSHDGSGGALDRVYLGKWATDLGVEDLLRKLG